MKILTTNFVKCTVKACDVSTESFPLKYQNCELVQEEQDFQPAFIINVLDRVDWDALVQVAKDLGNEAIPASKPAVLQDIDPDQIESNEELMAVLRDLHSLLMETSIVEGEMVCNHCGHIYYIKNSIPNFLLPPHLA